MASARSISQRTRTTSQSTALGRQPKVAGRVTDSRAGKNPWQVCVLQRSSGPGYGPGGGCSKGTMSMGNYSIGGLTVGNSTHAAENQLQALTAAAAKVNLKSGESAPRRFP